MVIEARSCKSKKTISLENMFTFLGINIGEYIRNNNLNDCVSHICTFPL